MCEYRQWEMSGEYFGYFRDIYNMNDILYLVLNFLVVLMNFSGNRGICGLETQRMIASISTVCLWLKVIDWLRLFANTAFYVHLI